MSGSLKEKLGGGDPSNYAVLQSNASAAKVAAESGLTLLQIIAADTDTVESAQAAMTTLLNQIKSYSDTEISDLLTAVNLIKGYTDGIESKTNLLTNATYGLSKIETYVDDIPSVLTAVNLIKGYTDGIEAKTNLLTGMNSKLNTVNTNTSGGTLFKKVWTGSSSSSASKVVLPSRGLYYMGTNNTAGCFFSATSTSTAGGGISLINGIVSGASGGLRPWGSAANKIIAAWQLGEW